MALKYYRIQDFSDGEYLDPSIYAGEVTRDMPEYTVYDSEDVRAFWRSYKSFLERRDKLTNRWLALLDSGVQVTNPDFDEEYAAMFSMARDAEQVAMAESGFHYKQLMELAERRGRDALGHDGHIGAGAEEVPYKPETPIVGGFTLTEEDLLRLFPEPTRWQRFKRALYEFRVFLHG